MMKNFAYYRPRTKEEAVGLLDSKWGTTELLAGGTDLPDLQKQHIAQPDKVVRIKGVGLGAKAKVQGPQGEREVELAKFFKAPASATDREHTLEPNDLVLSVTIPVAEGVKNASYEVRHKQAYDWPLVQAAVAFKLDGAKAGGVKIVLGHVAPTPMIAEAAAQALEGKDITEETAAAAGKAAAEGAKPLSQNAYKVKLVEVAVKRAILTAAGQKKYWET